MIVLMAYVIRVKIVCMNNLVPYMLDRGADLISRDTSYIKRQFSSSGKSHISRMLRFKLYLNKNKVNIRLSFCSLAESIAARSELILMVTFLLV